MTTRAQVGPTLDKALDDAASWRGRDLLATGPKRDDEDGAPPDKPRPLWIYGAVLGAAALGAGLILAADAGGRTQNIHISWRP